MIIKNVINIIINVSAIVIIGFVFILVSVIYESHFLLFSFFLSFFLF